MNTYSYRDLPARLAERITVNRKTGCWEVSNSRPRSSTPSPYRGMEWNGQLWQCHVLAYTLLIGPVPRDLVLDHVYDRGCRSQACCNPGHLEAVTGAVNRQRAIAAARMPSEFSSQNDD